MTIGDKTPSYEREKIGDENSQTPKESEPLKDISDVDIDELGSLDKPRLTEISTEPPIEPEHESPQVKESSSKIFLIFFLILLFAGLLGAVYFLEEKRSKTLLETQDKLARLESRLGVLQDEDFAQTLRDLVLLKQEFQAFKEQFSTSLTSRQSPIQQLPVHVEESPTDVNQVIITKEASPDIESEIPLQPSDDSKTILDEKPAVLQPFSSTLPSHKTLVDEIVQTPQKSQPSLSAPYTDSKLKESAGKRLERSEEAQRYIDFIESTATQLFELVKIGLSTILDYLAGLLS